MCQIYLFQTLFLPLYFAFEVTLQMQVTSFFYFLPEGFEAGNFKAVVDDIIASIYYIITEKFSHS